MTLAVGDVVLLRGFHWAVMEIMPSPDATPHVWLSRFDATGRAIGLEVSAEAGEFVSHPTFTAGDQVETWDGVVGTVTQDKGDLIEVSAERTAVSPLEGGGRFTSRGVSDIPRGSLVRANFL